jgi:hypothetical protein
MTDRDEALLRCIGVIVIGVFVAVLVKVRRPRIRFSPPPQSQRWVRSSE